jgi:hypothetical protein
LRHANPAAFPNSEHPTIDKNTPSTLCGTVAKHITLNDIDLGIIAKAVNASAGLAGNIPGAQYEPPIRLDA